MSMNYYTLLKNNIPIQWISNCHNYYIEGNENKICYEICPEEVPNFITKENGSKICVKGCSNPYLYENMDNHECLTNCNGLKKYNYQCYSSCPDFAIPNSSECKCDSSKYKFTVKKDLNNNTITECFPLAADCPFDKPYWVIKTNECIDADIIQCPNGTYKDANLKQCVNECTSDRYYGDGIDECFIKCDLPGNIFGTNEGYMIYEDPNDRKIC